MPNQISGFGRLYLRIHSIDIPDFMPVLKLPTKNSQRFHLLNQNNWWKRHLTDPLFPVPLLPTRTTRSLRAAALCICSTTCSWRPRSAARDRRSFLPSSGLTIEKSVQTFATSDFVFAQSETYPCLTRVMSAILSRFTAIAAERPQRFTVPHG